MSVNILWYYLNNVGRKSMYKFLGGDAPNGRGCPLSKSTLGNYIHQMDAKIGNKQLADQLLIRLTGDVQVDETFVRNGRKSHQGRMIAGLKYSLVTEAHRKLQYILWFYSRNMRSFWLENNMHKICS